MTMHISGHYQNTVISCTSSSWTNTPPNCAMALTWLASANWLFKITDEGDIATSICCIEAITEQTVLA